MRTSGFLFLGLVGFNALVFVGCGSSSAAGTTPPATRRPTRPTISGPT